MAPILFITGTDTGVGKTMLTTMLLWHCRAQGTRALAIKPFCSGSRADAEIIARVQGHELTIDEVNPYHFPEPLAPAVAARKHRRKVRLGEIVRYVEVVSQRCDCLIIEGCGGLMVPLGADFVVADLIARLQCVVIVVAPNKLGVINHTVLTVEAIRRRTDSPLKIVLVNQRAPDLSAKSNAKEIRTLLDGYPVIGLNYLQCKCLHINSLRDSCKKTKKTLARILA